MHPLVKKNPGSAHEVEHAYNTVLKNEVRFLQTKLERNSCNNVTSVMYMI